MEKEKDSIYNQVQLKFLGRHILSISLCFYCYFFLYNYAIVSHTTSFSELNFWKTDRKTTHYLKLTFVWITVDSGILRRVA